MIQETPIVSDAFRGVAALLPASWAVTERSTVGFDARLVLTAANGEEVSFVVEAKRSGSLPTAVLLTALRDVERRAESPVLFVSDYIGPSLRTALADEGSSFADATGWVRIVTDSPLILLTGQGADRSPRARQTTAVTRLNGVAASRTIRALVTASLPVGVRSLAAAADVSPGSVSKLLITLTSEGIVDRDPSGAVVGVRPRALIRRWVRDYSFAKSNPSVRYLIAPRGVDRALSQIDKRGGVAVTGSVAARRSLPERMTSVVPLRLLALYAADPQAIADDLGLIPAESSTANVVVTAPQDRAVLPAVNDREPAIAPVALVLADLLTLPGRSDAEADQLMDALAADDPAWKE